MNSIMRLFEGTKFDIPPVCNRCDQLEAQCTCPPPPVDYLAPEKQRPKLRLEKRKRGKTVTLVTNLAPTETDLQKLLTHLKNTCGAGGTIAENVIEIQGNQLDRVSSSLAELGYRISN